MAYDRTASPLSSHSQMERSNPGILQQGSGRKTDWWPVPQYKVKPKGGGGGGRAGSGGGGAGRRVASVARRPWRGCGSDDAPAPRSAHFSTDVAVPTAAGSAGSTTTASSCRCARGGGAAAARRRPRAWSSPARRRHVLHIRLFCHAGSCSEPTERRCCCPGAKADPARVIAAASIVCCSVRANTDEATSVCAAASGANGPGTSKNPADLEKPRVSPADCAAFCGPTSVLMAQKRVDQINEAADGHHQR